MASRRVARETPIRSASSRSGGETRPARVDPEPDRGGELLDAALEGVVPPHGTQDGLAQLDAGVGRHGAQSRDCDAIESMV